MLNTLIAIGSPLVVFGLVVFVHELGHFLAAKATGVYAPVFSLGWGKRLFGFKRGETDYRVSVFPLGGYVRMASREDESMAGIEGGSGRGDFVAEGDAEKTAPEVRAASALWDPEGMAPFGPRAVPADRWVESKSVAARTLILSAGVIMNILLTIVVATGVFFSYGSVYRPAIIGSVMEGTPAETAGLKAGDRIVAIDGDSIHDWGQVLASISPRSEGSVQVEVARGNDRVVSMIHPEMTTVFDSLSGTSRQVARIGIQVADTIARTPVALTAAVGMGLRATWGMTTDVAGVLKGLVKREVSVKNLGGPIAIARTSVQAAKSGAETFWSLIAFLSLNIGILNLLPIPVLDGGQIVITLAESVKGSAFSMRARENFARVGIAFVLALIVLVMFNDITALIRS